MRCVEMGCVAWKKRNATCVALKMVRCVEKNVTQMALCYVAGPIRSEIYVTYRKIMCYVLRYVPP